MRTFFLNLLRKSPFDGLLKHAECIRRVAPIFKSAFIAYLDESTEEFQEYHNQVSIMEHEGDTIKRNIRGHLPRDILLPMDKFQLLWFLREQDKVLDSVQDAMHWLSYRKTAIPDEMVDDFLLMVEKVIDVLNAVYPLVLTAKNYFDSFSEHHRELVKKAIAQIRELELQSDQVERKLLGDLFVYPFEDPTSAFHLVRLVEFMGNISNYAENAADRVRVMIAR